MSWPGDDEVGEEEVEADNVPLLLGAAPEFSIAVHPLAGPFGDLECSSRNWGRHALADDGAMEVRGIHLRSRGIVVLAAIAVDGDIIREAAELVEPDRGIW